MKTVFLFSLLCLIGRAGCAQSASISTDSSQIIFPSSVTVRLFRLPPKSKGFEITSHNLKILVTEINYLLARLQLEQKNVGYFRKNEEIMKSLLTVTEKKYLSELERTLLHRSAYEKVEKIAAVYQKELDSCKADLQTLTREKSGSKRKGFVKGIVWGLVVGGAAGIIISGAVK